MEKNSNFTEIEKIINDSINEATKNLAKSFTKYNMSLLENLSKINPFITTGLVEFFNEKMNVWEEKD